MASRGLRRLFGAGDGERDAALRRLAAWVDRLAAGELDASPPDLGELAGEGAAGELASALGRMAVAVAAERRQQRAADAERRRLLADISHELATPLTSIRASAETLLDSDVPLAAEERQQFLVDLLGEARRMELLIKDLFDLTRLESRALGLRVERLDWAELCRHTVERYRPRFEGAGLELRYAGLGRGAAVDADGRRLEQVLENLLANALRYVSAPGLVAVELRRLGGRGAPEDGPTRFRLEVADDGPGISEDDLGRIFDRFYKADRDRSSAGSGLGLAIVRELIERHGGRVEARNRDPLQGTGAVLNVELPAAESADEAERRGAGRATK